MSPEAERRLLRGLMVLVGVVPILAGAFAVATGTDGVLGDDGASTNVDSEFRYFASFYVAFGAAALYLAPRVERETKAVRALALVLFAGGVARGIGWASTDRPDDQLLVLLCLELLIPPLLVVWQRRVARAAGYAASE
jgi:hypothetical protein